MRAFVIVMVLAACGNKSETKPEAKPTEPKPEVKKSPLETIELSVVANGFDRVQPPDLLLVVSTTAIALGDKPIIALTDGVADAADREGGALGMKIPKLAQELRIAAGAGPRYPLQVAIDRRVPYRTMIEVLYSAKQQEAGFKEFHLLAKQGSDVVHAPIVLPDKRPASASGDDISPRRPGADLGKQINEVKEAGKAGTVGGGKAKPDDARKPKPKRDDPSASADKQTGDEPPTAAYSMTFEANDPTMPQRHPDEMPLQLVVSIAKDQVQLWSISGLEGALTNPKLSVPLDGAGAAVRKALVEIAARRWAGKERKDHSIVLMADGATPMQRIAELIAAVRATDDGKPLFHDIMFSSGFE